MQIANTLHWSRRTHHGRVNWNLWQPNNFIFCENINLNLRPSPLLALSFCTTQSRVQFHIQQECLCVWFFVKTLLSALHPVFSLMALKKKKSTNPSFTIERSLTVWRQDSALLLLYSCLTLWRHHMHPKSSCHSTGYKDGWFGLFTNSRGIRSPRLSRRLEAVRYFLQEFKLFKTKP